jgi:DNA-directed RNA polymerase sigma subunit (sigma70/sigma32)
MAPRRSRTADENTYKFDLPFEGVLNASATPEELVAEREEVGYILDIARKVVSPRDYSVIVRAFELSPPFVDTLRDIAKAEGLSSTRITGILRGGLSKLRKN